MANWLPIEGSDGYWVSDLGRVRSARRKLKPALGNHGYLVVAVKGNDGKHRMRLVHRLVAAAFCPASPWRNHVNHLNSVRTDNRASNLEWVTPQENQDHARIAGRLAVGELQPTSRLTNWDAWRIPQWVAGGLSDSEIAGILGVGRENIGCIRRGKTWSHITGAAAVPAGEPDAVEAQAVPEEAC